MAAKKYGGTGSLDLLSGKDNDSFPEIKDILKEEGDPAWIFPVLNLGKQLGYIETEIFGWTFQLTEEGEKFAADRSPQFRIVRGS